MTGYGRATSALGGFSLTVQVSSVNRKTLDLTIGLPEEWESLEPAIAELVRKFASRGKVHLDVEVTGNKSTTEPTWDEAGAAAALERLQLFASRQGVEFRPTERSLENRDPPPPRIGNHPRLARRPAPATRSAHRAMVRTHEKAPTAEGEAGRVQPLRVRGSSPLPLSARAT